MVLYVFSFAYKTAKLQYVPLFNTAQNGGMKPFFFTNRQYKQD